MAIPLLLGCLNLLYPAACWLLLAACIVVAYRRHREPPAPERAPVPFVTVAALALVAWPQLMRPLLDGDSLSYHLPNAASWVHAHGVWTTGTRYWWYPPASELFASGLYATCGPFALGWAGFGALALVGLRVASWARVEFGAPPWLADALAAAVVTAMPLALQGASLQNDVWLAAFWLESLWLLRQNAVSAWTAIAMCALIKPDGWIFAAIAAIALRARPVVWIGGIAAIVAWAIRDAVLWQSAIVPPSSTSFGDVFHTAIAAHGLPAISELLRVLLLTSPFSLIALAGALAAPFVLRGTARALGWCAFAATVLFVALPFGYDNGDLQLATGASVRFAAPAIALGGLLLAIPALRAPRVATLLLLLSALAGAALIVSIFANDLPTLTAIAVAAVAIVIALVPQLRNAQWPAVSAIVVAVVASTVLAQRNALDYYNDALTVNGTKPGIYLWITAFEPVVVAGWGLPVGVINVISPNTQTIDVPDATPCQTARAQRALLVTVAESKHGGDENARRLNIARACGTVVYDDGIAVVVKPR
ncbi:MAG TPA: hypothetical protein VK760_13745 [Candidatus Acidoferrales bacterium]|nr:hypothetical protein [Candidatus Acidoferrales bacterium]